MLKKIKALFISVKQIFGFCWLLIQTVAYYTFRFFFVAALMSLGFRLFGLAH